MFEEDDVIVEGGRTFLVVISLGLSNAGLEFEYLEVFK